MKEVELTLVLSEYPALTKSPRKNCSLIFKAATDVINVKITKSHAIGK
jgi:hypothetical protein